MNLLPAPSPPPRPAAPLQLNFEDFCNVLQEMSERVFVLERSTDDRFQRLVFGHVLAFAHRREYFDVSSILSHASVSTLFAYYADSLSKIFGYYATHDKRVAARLTKSAGGLAPGQGRGISHVGSLSVPSTKVRDLIIMTFF
jgi:hypothetical protein